MRPKSRTILIAVAAALFVFWVALGPKNNQPEKGGLLPKDSELVNFRNLDIKEQQKLLLELADKQGTEEMRLFLRAAYPDGPSHKHELSHTVGELLFKEAGLAALGLCDRSFEFGCYHSVVLEAVKKYGFRENLTEELREGCKKAGPAYFGCIHGLGHAVMVLKSYDLKSAYEFCENAFAPDPKEQFWCYDGVSMENTVRAVAPEGLSGNLPTRDNIRTPCLELPEKYQGACAREHLHYAAHGFLSNDAVKIADYCLGFQSESTREQCFYGMGANLHGRLYDKPSEIVSGCLKGGQYSRFCATNAATQFAVSKNKASAELVCREADAGPDCLKSVNEALQ